MEKDVKLDLKDKKILAELDWDARITKTKLAQKIGLSKKAVEYRIKQLEKVGIIEGYYPIINFNILGFITHRASIKLQYLDDNIKKQIEEYLIKENGMNWVIWTNGYIDLAMDTWSKSLKETKDVYLKFQLKFGEYIKNIEFSTTIGFDQYPYNFILGISNNSEIKIGEEKKIVELNEIEKKILKVLTENARQNSSEIARRIHSNYKTVEKKMKDLFQKRVLLGNRAIINTEKMGYKYYKILLFLNPKFKNKLKDVEKYIKRQSETVYIVDHLGDEDIDAEMIFKSENDFEEFINKLNNNFPEIIKGYNQIIFIKTVKINYVPHKL